MSEQQLYSNFCAAFLDILGQRKAMEGQDLLILGANGEPSVGVKKGIDESIGKILSFQNDADYFLVQDPSISIRETLGERQKATYDAVNAQKMKRQRWSDGLVLYTSMNAVAPMNAIYEVIFASGCLCLQQLAKRSPIRGGIDISWGVELHENELYGAIVSNSYTLESEVAQIPRIVVGDRVANYIEAAINSADMSKDEDKLNRGLAEYCKGLLMRDLDGYLIINYLSRTLIDSIGKETAVALYKRALSFVHDEYELHREKQRNSKLASRYNWLASYLEANNPENS